MTKQEIFQKEALTAQDLAFLFSVTEQMAYKIIRQIKFKCDRLKIQGRVHIEDYFEYFGITDRTLYKGEEKWKVIKHLKKV